MIDLINIISMIVINMERVKTQFVTYEIMLNAARQYLFCTAVNAALLIYICFNSSRTFAAN